MSSSKVFVNRILNLKKIKMIGLDMDHTLIRYQTAHFEALVYDLVIDYLITAMGYPAAIHDFDFHFDDAIRGLVIDRRHGNILKLSRYGAIRLSYHGTRKINFLEQNRIYRSTYVDLGDDNYMAVDTSFSIAFCVLYQQLVDFKDDNPGLLHDYQTIAHDVQFAVDVIHSNGSLKNKISSNLDYFLLREPEVVQGLLNFQAQGKDIIIVTNSDYAYTRMLLDYAINPFMPEGKSWKDLFSLVITLAGKPRFFYDNLKFLAIDAETGMMKNHIGPVVPGLYQGGNAKKLAHDLGLQGDEILYIGDHIYGDILRLKKDCNWRTALVVDELGGEIAAQQAARPITREIGRLMADKTALEGQYTNLKAGDAARKEALQEQIMQIDQQIGQALDAQQAYFNPRWERVFRAGAEESYFANQVERFACIYMEKLSDLLALSPNTYFRAFRRSLPHDFD